MNLLFSSIWWKEVWRMNRSVGLLIITTTLDGFSLANCRQFAKLSTRQTFPLCSIYTEISKGHNYLPHTNAFGNYYMAVIA